MSTEEKTTFTGAFDLFSKSWDLVKQNLPAFGLVYSLSIFLNLIGFGTRKADQINTMNYSQNLAAILGVSLGIAAIIFVASLVLQVMALGLQVETAKGKKPDAAWMWEFARKNFFRVLILGIVVGFLVVGGLILFIVPGLIMITRYYLAPYVMASEDLGVLDAMRRSAELSKGRWKQIWGVILVMILISVVPSIFFGRVGSLVATLLGAAYSVAPALRYLELKRAK